jgi:hypothetical protein
VRVSFIDPLLQYPPERRTMSHIQEVMALLEVHRRQLQNELDQVDQVISTLSGLKVGTHRGIVRGGKRTLSATGRKNIAAAQRARWAKWRKESARA